MLGIWHSVSMPPHAQGHLQMTVGISECYLVLKPFRYSYQGHQDKAALASAH